MYIPWSTGSYNIEKKKKMLFASNSGRPDTWQFNTIDTLETRGFPYLFAACNYADIPGPFLLSSLYGFGLFGCTRAARSIVCPCAPPSMFAPPPPPPQYSRPPLLPPPPSPAADFRDRRRLPLQTFATATRFLSSSYARAHVDSPKAADCRVYVQHGFPRYYVILGVGRLRVVTHTKRTTDVDDRSSGRTGHKKTITAKTNLRVFRLCGIPQTILRGRLAGDREDKVTGNSARKIKTGK